MDHSVRRSIKNAANCDNSHDLQTVLNELYSNAHCAIGFNNLWHICLRIAMQSKDWTSNRSIFESWRMFWIFRKLSVVSEGLIQFRLDYDWRRNDCIKMLYCLRGAMCACACALAVWCKALPDVPSSLTGFRSLWTLVHCNLNCGFIHFQGARTIEI